MEILKYLKKYWTFEQLIVSEIDVNPKAINLIPDWADYIFAKEKDSDQWSRAKRINLPIPLIKNEITIILDADLIVDYYCVQLSVEKIIKDEIDALTPFEKVYHFPRSIVLKEMQNKEIKTNEFCKNKSYSRSFVANGGCFITKTSIFKHIRGMNESFIGWGLEDDELINRYIKLGYRYGRISGVSSIHINHERTKNCEIDLENFNRSLIEKNKGILFSKEEMLSYFGITEHLGEYNQINKNNNIQNEKLLELVDKEKQAYFNLKSEPYEI